MSNSGWTGGNFAGFMQVLEARIHVQISMGLCRFWKTEFTCYYRWVHAGFGRQNSHATIDGFMQVLEDTCRYHAGFGRRNSRTNIDGFMQVLEDRIHVQISIGSCIFCKTEFTCKYRWVHADFGRHLQVSCRFWRHNLCPVVGGFGLVLQGSCRFWKTEFTCSSFIV